MPYDPDKHHRRSTRLRDYDYSQAGAYFVTIVTHSHRSFFGQIADGAVRLNEAGQITAQCWLQLPERLAHLELDEFAVMPNHLHGILVLDNAQSATLGQIIRTFKAKASHTIGDAGTLDFAWQRNYHDRIIRNQRELDAIRQYIAYNPANWDFDKENDW
jgi:putative transposase